MEKCKFPGSWFYRSRVQSSSSVPYQLVLTVLYLIYSSFDRGYFGGYNQQSKKITSMSTKSHEQRNFNLRYFSFTIWRSMLLKSYNPTLPTAVIHPQNVSDCTPTNHINRPVYLISDHIHPSGSAVPHVRNMFVLKNCLNFSTFDRVKKFFLYLSQLA